MYMYLNKIHFDRISVRNGQIQIIFIFIFTTITYSKSFINTIVQMKLVFT